MTVKPSKLFSGNPFHTPAGELVVKATDASLSEANWDLIKLVCDYINVNNSAPKDAFKAIKKRLSKNKNFHQVNITLSLLETCVKKCDFKFRKYVMTKEFCFDTLLAVLQPSNNPGITLTQRVLFDLQEWAFVFGADQRLVGVKLAYLKLLQKGVVFPPPGQVAVTAKSQGNVKFRLTLPAKLTPKEVAKIRNDVAQVNCNVKVLSEMLIEHNPLTCCSEDFSFMQEISKTCRAMHGRAFELFSHVDGDGLKATLLTAMDDLNNVLLRYDRFEKFREAKNGDYVFPESLSSASSLRSVSTGAENIYVDNSPSHLSTTSSTYETVGGAITPGQQEDATIYALAADVEDLSLENKTSSSAPAVSYPILNGLSYNNAEETNETPHTKVRHSIGSYVKQSMGSWDEVG